jgi:hypothetical protein
MIAGLPAIRLYFGCSPKQHMPLSSVLNVVGPIACRQHTDCLQRVPPVIPPLIATKTRTGLNEKKKD